MRLLLFLVKMEEIRAILSKRLVWIIADLGKAKALVADPNQTAGW